MGSAAADALAPAAYTGRQMPSGLSTMSRNFKLFLGAAVTFYLAGSMNQAAELFVLAGVCLACILGCYVISRLGVEGLALKVRPRGGPVWAHSDIELTIELSNIGLIPRPPVPVRVNLRNTTVQTDPASYFFPLPGLSPGQSVTTTGVVVPTCRGEYVIGEPRLVGRDPLGMFDRPGRPAQHDDQRGQGERRGDGPAVGAAEVAQVGGGRVEFLSVAVVEW